MPLRTHVGWYVGQVQNAEEQLEQAFVLVAEKHQREPEILRTCKLLASWCRCRIELLEQLSHRFNSRDAVPDPEPPRAAWFHGKGFGGLGLLRDLHDLSVLVSDVQIGWIILRQAAAALHDQGTEAQCIDACQETARQLEWVTTQIKVAAPQALTVVAPPTADVPATLPK